MHPAYPRRRLVVVELQLIASRAPTISTDERCEPMPMRPSRVVDGFGGRHLRSMYTSTLQLPCLPAESMMSRRLLHNAARFCRLLQYWHAEISAVRVTREKDRVAAGSIWRCASSMSIANVTRPADQEVKFDVSPS
ncbi:hypothetical protein CERZMDRAFT_118583 [Cercospora zeae-maydis SCOH1-5]|uniref:Uncharacterized protein n=1 Tax=Cercospora zeae-maydis SCOH1-5 TaxID=717836 RepID=A0A6A6F5R9_9PEZI|nr:hypothetical protein CERZMDRAFT_118583 [Cercospora zeae-maydis SCOH1-5]